MRGDRRGCRLKERVKEGKEAEMGDKEENRGEDRDGKKEGKKLSLIHISEPTRRA